MGRDVGKGLGLREGVGSEEPCLRLALQPQLGTELCPSPCKLAHGDHVLGGHIISTTTISLAVRSCTAV